MKAHGGGNIVNVASISGITADASGTLYGASKAGVINLTRYIATQVGKKNIRCNAVAPGLVLTPAALNNMNEDVRNIFLGQCLSLIHIFQIIPLTNLRPKTWSYNPNYAVT